MWYRPDILEAIRASWEWSVAAVLFAVAVIYPTTRDRP